MLSLIGKKLEVIKNPILRRFTLRSLQIAGFVLSVSILCYIMYLACNIFGGWGLLPSSILILAASCTLVDYAFGAFE